MQTGAQRLSVRLLIWDTMFKPALILLTPCQHRVIKSVGLNGLDFMHSLVVWDLGARSPNVNPCEDPIKIEVTSLRTILHRL